MSNNFQNICWSSTLSLFATGSNDGNYFDSVVTSPDGINWTRRTPDGTISYLVRDITWIQELNLFILIGNTSAPYPVIYTSPDGITWTQRFNPPATNTPTSICWSPELSLAVAVTTSTTGYTSSNGTTWTSRVALVANRICWSPELLLFVAVGNNIIGYSSTGTSWTTITPPASNTWTGVCWSSELYLFVAVSSSGTGNRVMTSPNGINWTTRASPADITWNHLCWSPELSLFVAVASTGATGRIMSSSDGILWTISGGTSTSSSDLSGICWSPELSVFTACAIGGSTGNRILTSNLGFPNSKSTLLVSPAHLTYNDQTGSIAVTGALSKGSGTFDITHPLDSSKRLVHSFIEGPRCDLIYRGHVQLQNGTAVVNIDSDSVAQSDCAMTEGTFETLTTNPVYYLQNYTSFDSVRGIISGNQLTIVCENPLSSDTIHWYVIAERKDPFIKSWDRTNENGYLITEYSK